jgi:hypothetical protein
MSATDNLRILQPLAPPSFLHGSECWTLAPTKPRKMKFLISVVGYGMDKTRNTDIRQEINTFAQGEKEY